MRNRLLVLFIGSVALLATSFCVQKDKNSRDVSSGSVAGLQDQVITMPTDLGLWILSKSSVNEPVNTTYMTVYYKCDGDTKQRLYDNQPITMLTGSDDLPARAYSWGELKSIAPDTYKSERGVLKPQGVRTVIWVKYRKTPEYDFTGTKGVELTATNTEKMVVLDMSDVCQE